MRMIIDAMGGDNELFPKFNLSIVGCFMGIMVS